MALKVWEGFDHYNNAVDLGARSGYLQWTVGPTNNIFQGYVPGTAVVKPGLAVTFFTLDGESILLGTLADRNATGFTGTRQLWANAGGQTVHFNDTVANLTQVSVYFNPNNYAIQIYRGTTATGTLLFTSANNVWAGQVMNFIEIGVTINGSTGSVKVRVNNTEVASVTGVNTQNTGNAWFDQIGYLARMSVPSTSMLTTIDDFYFCDDVSGPGPNPFNDFIGDARTVTNFAVGDNSVQFTPLFTSSSFGSSVTGHTQANAANQLAFAPFTIDYGGVLQTSLLVDLNAGFTGNMVVGIYDSDGPAGVPGTLLAQTNVLTNPVTGVNTFTFSSTPTLFNEHTYYWAILQDSSAVMVTGSAADTWFFTPQLYSGTMPGTVASDTFTTASSHVAAISGTLTTVNWGMVSEIAMDGDTSYNFSSTLHNEDTLNFQPLPASVDLILGVQVTGAYCKDDAGSRAIEQTLKSGATQQYSADHYLAVGNYAYFTDAWVLDPDTSTTWTASGVNALAAGYKITV